MIDLKYAKENINKYKFDYSGYLVIVDTIRTADIIENGGFYQMKKQLIYLNKKYEKELLFLKKYLDDTTFLYNINNLKGQQIKKKLEEFNSILPAIGYVNLGLIKEIIKN
ncbi:MAG: hypothetical protein SOU19_06835 [Candidatus Caccosoma sp.]|nr:hypothetical protein [Candidatus Caccosoma sp.]